MSNTKLLLSFVITVYSLFDHFTIHGGLPKLLRTSFFDATMILCRKVKKRCAMYNYLHYVVNKNIQPNSLKK